MLQQRTFIPPLGAADELASMRNQLSFGRRLEARSGARGARSPGWRSRLDRNAKLAQACLKKAVDAEVSFAQRRGIFRGRGDAVSDLAVMQNRAAAGRPSHDVDIGSANLPDVVKTRCGLIAPERERRPAPGIDAEHRFASASRTRLQRGVPRHVLGARAWSGEEKAPGAVTSPRVHRVLNCHSYEHHNQAR